MMRRHLEPTQFVVDLDDDTMESMLEQSELAGVAPRELLSVVLKAVFAGARESGEQLVEVIPTTH